MSTFNPSQAEIALTSQIFNLADPQKLGIVTGDTAVKVLSGANLSHAVLGEVWAIADKDNNGFLTRKGVAIALRLIGHAQKGEPVTEALLNKSGPIAHIDGVSVPVTTGSPTPPSPVPKSPPSKPSAALPPLTQQDKAKFFKLFIGCSPVNGLLSGDKARDVFVKSKLPFEKLSHIWTLADTKARGTLDSTDFTIGMYLIQASMASPTLTLPVTLPSWVYDQAAQSSDAPPSLVSHTTGGSASALGSPLQNSFQIPRQHTGSGAASLSSSAIKPQYTGQQIPPRQTPSTHPVTVPAVSSSFTPFRAPQAQTHSWDVSAEAKAKADQFFDSLDRQRRGYIEGDVAVPFMLESKLPESDLAQIWDLADLRNDGCLTREGFAVAMHIINSKLAGNDIPSTLPPSLVPPSMRQPQSPGLEMANEPQVDLLGDAIPSNTAVQPQATGGSGNAQIRPPAPSSVSNHGTGQGAFPQGSQSAFQSFTPSRQTSTFVSAVNNDLLGDDDEVSHTNAVPDNSAEIGNLQNQVASTNRSLSVTQAERASTEQIVTQQASQLSQLQTQLSSAKASYETESRLLTTLRERLTAQRSEIQTTREELIRAESQLSATKVEKAEVEGSVLRDKEEVRDLQRRMKDVGAETDALKLTIEKAKKDARQQKGLLAIAKKQLATAEADKIKVSKELEIAQRELDVAQKEKDDVDAHVAALETSRSSPIPEGVTSMEPAASPAPSTFAAGIPLPDTPQSHTPQPSVSRHTTNPFERLAMAAGVSGSTSPFRTLSPSNDTTPLAAAEATVTPSDPFGFSEPPSDGYNAGAQLSTSSEDIVGTPKPIVNTLASTPAELSSPASVVSPSDNEAAFMTPLSTGNALDPDGGVITLTSELAKPLPGVLPHNMPNDGLLEPLQELENDGSDSSDSDNEPLGAKLFTAKQLDSNNTSPPNISSEHPPGLAPSPKTTFDDSFGIANDLAISPAVVKASPPTSGKSSPRRSRSPGRALSTRTLSTHSITGAVDPFGASSYSKTPLEPPAGEHAPPPTIETVLEPSAGPMHVASISDFDEALGKMPNSSMDAPSTFKFDSAFDDNFDFSSAINGNTTVPASQPEHNGASTEATTNFPPVSAPLTPSIPVVSSSPGAVPEVGVVSFDEAFAPNPPASSANGGPAVSFNDAFGLNSAVPNTQGQQPTSNGNGFSFENAIGSSTSQDPKTMASHLPAAPSSPPLSARTQPSPPSARSVSPPIRPASPRQPRASLGSPRAASPPPRASSPRIRALSGSKNSYSETKSEAPVKHKLSIRFPFGRKDKTKDKEDKRAHSQAHQVLPEQQQFLSPVQEPTLPRTLTPAVEDDVESVKQLSAMGFSRTQAIAALETHGYDMQKALNSLLGAA